MKAEHVNAFIDATHETFQAMCRTSFRRKGPLHKVGGQIVDTEELVAICGLSGDIKGAVMISTPLETGKKIVGAFLCDKITEINCDLMDGWGEIINIIAGAAGAKINDLKFSLALPSVIYGSEAKFYAKAGNPFVLIHMEIPDWGPFTLGISMEIK